jgi:hypothetical protein
MIWECSNKDLGVVPKNTKLEVEFAFIGNKEEINTITTSCSCANYKLHNNKLVLRHTTGAVPFYLKSVGEYTTEISANVFYKDAPKQILTFKVTVKEDVIPV